MSDSTKESSAGEKTNGEEIVQVISWLGILSSGLSLSILIPSLCYFFFNLGGSMGEALEAVVGVVFSLALLWASIGMLKYKNTCRLFALGYIAVVYFVFPMLSTAIDYAEVVSIFKVAGEAFSFWPMLIFIFSTLFHLFIYGGIAWLLMQPRVVALFENEQGLEA